MYPKQGLQYVVGVQVDGENYYKTQTTSDRETINSERFRTYWMEYLLNMNLGLVKNKEKILDEIKSELKPF